MIGAFQIITMSITSPWQLASDLVDELVDVEVVAEARDKRGAAQECQGDEEAIGARGGTEMKITNFILFWVSPQLSHPQTRSQVFTFRFI